MADNAGDNVYAEGKDSVPSNPNSPDSLNPKDGSPDHGTQEESQSAQKQPKVVWEDDETRCFIQMYKRHCPKLEDPSYTLTRLLHDISIELQRMGYPRKFSSVRYRWKSLRAAYKRVANSRCAHPERKLPYFKEVAEIFGRKPVSNGSALQHSRVPLAMEHVKSEPGEKNQNLDRRPVKRLNLGKDYSEYRTVDDFVIRTKSVKKKIKNGYIPSQNGSSSVKKDSMKKTPQLWSPMMYQCGTCKEKFRSSQEMHAHNCRGEIICDTPVKIENDIGKNYMPNNEENAQFHWNSMKTLQFLELLKQYSRSNRTTRERKEKIWEEVTQSMLSHGHNVNASQLKSKLKVLLTAYKKTLNYNKVHEDKKRCAFFNRLSELHDFLMALEKSKPEEPVKMTVEVSPFSYSSCYVNQDDVTNSYTAAQVPPVKAEEPVTESRELVARIDRLFREWKEMEKQREEIQAQRHGEMMEVLSCIAEALVK